MKRLFYCAAFVAAMGLFTTANAQNTTTTKKEVKKEQCDKKCDKKDGKACCKAGEAKKECCKADKTKKSCSKETAAKKK